MFQIVEIQKDRIMAYVDETFLVFHRNALITGADCIGVVWAGGKGKAKNLTTDVSLLPVPALMKRNSCYHDMITAHLIELAEKQIE